MINFQKLVKKFYKEIEIIGVIFLISGCTFTVGTSTSKKKSEPNYTYHYVKSGENLFRISEYYYDGKSTSEIKVGVEKIKKANNLFSDNISCGQKLKIPGTNKKQPSYALLPPSSNIKQPSSDRNEVETKNEYIPIIKDSAFIWPVEKGDIICKYGELGNQGIDIIVEQGSTVFSSAAGTVSYVGTTAKYQETIIIEHTNNLYTIYGHDLEILTKKGEKVKKGQVIGKIKGGTQKKRYLHFEIRIGDKAVDPLIYLPEK